MYLVYRWVMVAYFFGWLIATGVSYTPFGGAKFFIFLTDWSFLAWNAYLIASAASTTVKIVCVHCCGGPLCNHTSRQTLLDKPVPYIDIDKPVGCCGATSDETSWYQKIQWILFYLGVEMALLVAVLYWLLLYDGGNVDGINANTHLINAIIALVEIFISGVPVRVLHLYISISFAAIFLVFTGIYHAADGTNLQDDPFIYNVLDYGNSPGTASGWALGVTFAFVPLFHMIVFGLYSIRFWLTYHLWKKLEPQNQLPPTGNEEMGEIRKTDS